MIFDSVKHLIYGKIKMALKISFSKLTPTNGTIRLDFSPAFNTGMMKNM